ncbi:hypothetical protein ACVWXM_000132 [Bradyrhizobium sp. GM7.3]
MQIDGSDIPRSTQLDTPPPTFEARLIMNFIANCAQSGDSSFSLVRHDHDVQIEHQPNSSPFDRRRVALPAP